MMRILITTQFRENYGAHDWDGTGECPQYWKFKGGDEIIVEVEGFRFDSEFARKNAEIIIDSMRSKIEHKSDYSEEYILGWEFIEDDFMTQFEKDQLEFDGAIKFPAKRINYDEFVAEAA
jgi:hypothetical protein